MRSGRNDVVKSSEGQEAPGPDRQVGRGIGAWFTSLEQGKGQKKEGMRKGKERGEKKRLDELV